MRKKTGMSRTILLGLITACSSYAGLTPSWPQTWNMAASTVMMVCNSTGPVDAVFASKWGVYDLDWNGDRVHWSATRPMDCEENMLRNINAIKAVNPNGIGLLYRNGVKALPWFTTVRKLLEDRSQWGLFMPLAGCSPAPGVYTCGPNATTNLYHDYEQTPPRSGDCGVGVECGEYVFNHRNASLLNFFLGDYYFGETSGGNANVSGFYIDDSWSKAGPSEMDADAVKKMGMSAADVEAMVTAWETNRDTWRAAFVERNLWEWYFFYGGQQTAPGVNQTNPASTCASYLRANCGPNTPPQNATLFYGYSRSLHSKPWPLPWPTEDLALFLLTRGPYAFFGYGWSGCVSPDGSHPFTRPSELDVDYGVPTSDCSETSPGVFERGFRNAHVAMDCNSFNATIMPGG